MENVQIDADGDVMSAVVDSNSSTHGDDTVEPVVTAPAALTALAYAARMNFAPLGSPIAPGMYRYSPTLMRNRV